MTRVLCAGIATLDQVFGVAAMPTRAEKYRAHALSITGGGTAANAAVALARLGAEVLFYGALGDDPLGDEILAGLAREGVDASAVRRVPGLRSPLSAIIVDGSGERMIVSYSDPRLPGPTDWLPDRLPDGVAAVLGDTRWQAGAAHVFRLARRAGVPAILDGDRAPHEVPELLDLATHVALSAQGLRDLTGLPEPEAGLRAFGRREGGVWLGVTNGAAGAWAWEGDAVIHVPALDVRAVDTLGAGDTWHAAFTLALAEGRSEREAMRFAAVAAAIKCTRFGGRDGAPTRGEVEARLAEGAPGPTGAG